jgi:hypothetical protein
VQAPDFGNLFILGSRGVGGIVEAPVVRYSVVSLS